MKSILFYKTQISIEKFLWILRKSREYNLNIECDSKTEIDIQGKVKTIDRNNGRL